MAATIPPVQVNVVPKGDGVMAQPTRASIYNNNQVIHWELFAPGFKFGSPAIEPGLSPPADNDWPGNYKVIIDNESVCEIDFNQGIPPSSPAQGYQYFINVIDPTGAHRRFRTDGEEVDITVVDPDIANQNQP